MGEDLQNERTKKSSAASRKKPLRSVMTFVTQASINLLHIEVIRQIQACDRRAAE